MRGASARVWLASLACLVVLFGAVAWVSATVLGLEHSREDMRVQAWIEENVRLSLWRMDSAVAPLLARESVRPAADFQGLAEPDPYIVRRFQFDAAGRLSSSGRNPAAGVGWADAITRERVLEALALAQPSESGLEAGKLGYKEPPPTQQEAQLRKSANEYVQRSLSVGNVYAKSVSGSLGLIDGLERDANAGTVAPLQPMTPVWIDDQLLLARRVDAGADVVVQGSLLDWPAMSDFLLSSVADLLPEARLTRSGKGQDNPARTLVSLPVVLHAGALPAMPGAGSAVAWILVVVWCAVLLAAGAAVALIVGVSALSERRAAFVAAVTHELRTPLTTLQTYSEMLADGKIKDEPKRERYVRTLHRESVRLGHLVENVLSYSRIERGRAGVRRDVVSARALLERARERLSERALGAAMELRLELPETAGALELIGDQSAVEQIVFNLVDNAGKYGKSTEQPYIDVSAQARGQHIEIRVRDHGPGVPDDVRGRLFRPFSKSVETAAMSAPGVGLGLALGQRLARAMGGRLALDSSSADGACFVLRLRAAGTDGVDSPA